VAQGVDPEFKPQYHKKKKKKKKERNSPFLPGSVKGFDNIYPVTLKMGH
jgi:hypothetical protein